MKVREILVEQKEPSGTYAGVRFSEDTIRAVQKYCSDHKIPNPIPKDKIHCTLLHSKKYLPNYEPLGELNKPLIGNPTGFDVWKSKPKKDKPEPNACLVLQFKCDELVKRHEFLMKEHDAQYDFDEYKPHITFSYNIGDFEVDELPPFDHTLKIVEEYGQDLEEDWADKNTKD